MLGELPGHVLDGPEHLRPVLDRGARRQTRAMSFSISTRIPGSPWRSTSTCMNDSALTLASVPPLPRSESGLEDLDNIAVVVVSQSDDRVDHQVDVEPVAHQLHHHGVDEERHVIDVRLHHRVRRLPTVLVEPGLYTFTRTPPAGGFCAKLNG